MVGVTAEYTLLDDGSIKALNKGYKKKLYDKLKNVEAKARVSNEKDPSVVYHNKVDKTIELQTALAV